MWSSVQWLLVNCLVFASDNCFMSRSIVSERHWFNIDRDFHLLKQLSVKRTGFIFGRTSIPKRLMYYSLDVLKALGPFNCIRTTILTRRQTFTPRPSVRAHHTPHNKILPKECLCPYLIIVVEYSICLEANNGTLDEQIDGNYWTWPRQ